MKITQKELKHIVQEELTSIINEAFPDIGRDYKKIPVKPTIEDTLEDILRRLATIETKLKIKRG